MKNRRNTIVAFLLCACLIVGIGYAALTTDLFLNGKAAIDKALAEEVFDSYIVWESVDITADGSATDKASASLTDDTIHITANGLDTIDQVVTATCVMKNNSDDVNALVTIPTLTPEGDAGNYITIALDSTSQNTIVDGKIKLDAGQTATVIVTFTLKKAFVPTDTLSTVSSTFRLTYTAEAQPNA